MSLSNKEHNCEEMHLSIEHPCCERKKKAGQAPPRVHRWLFWLLPLAGLVGLASQVTVLAYCFGDGFSNLMYPTNPVLLICLGLTTVRYSKWLAWSLPLWLAVIAASVAFLGLAVAVGYGPF